MTKIKQEFFGGPNTVEISRRNIFPYFFITKISNKILQEEIGYFFSELPNKKVQSIFINSNKIQMRHRSVVLMLSFLIFFQ